MVIASKGGPVANNEIGEIGRDPLGKALCVSVNYMIFILSLIETFRWSKTSKNIA